MDGTAVTTFKYDFKNSEIFYIDLRVHVTATNVDISCQNKTGDKITTPNTYLSVSHINLLKKILHTQIPYFTSIYIRTRG